MNRFSTYRRANNRKGHKGYKSGPSVFPKGLKASLRRPFEAKGSRGYSSSTLPPIQAPNVYTSPRGY